jgi:hypothetical protein
LENCGCDRSLRGMSPEGFQVKGRRHRCIYFHFTEGKRTLYIYVLIKG